MRRRALSLSHLSWANYPRTGKQNSILVNVTSRRKTGTRPGTHRVPEAALTAGTPSAVPESTDLKTTLTSPFPGPPTLSQPTPPAHSTRAFVGKDVKVTTERDELEAM